MIAWLHFDLIAVQIPPYLQTDNTLTVQNEIRNGLYCSLIDFSLISAAKSKHA